MREHWSVYKERLVDLENGLIPTEVLPSGKPVYKTSVCKQVIQCVKLILYLELLLFIGWACYSMWQAYRIKSMGIKVTDTIQVPESQSTSEHPNHFMGANQNKFVNNELAMILNATENYVGLNENHDLPLPTHTGKISVLQSDESSAPFAVNSLNSKEKQGTKHLEIDEVRNVNPGSSKTQKYIMESPTRFMADHDVASGSKYTKRTKIIPTIQNHIAKGKSKRQESEKEETLENYVFLLSVLYSTLSDSQVLTDFTGIASDKQEGSRGHTTNCKSIEDQNIIESKTAMKSSNTEEELEQKLIETRNYAVDEVSVVYADVSMEANKQRQQEILLDTDKYFQSEGINHEHNAENLPQDYTEKEIAESVTELENKDVGINRNISGAALSSFSSKSDVMSRRTNVMREVIGQKDRCKKERRQKGHRNRSATSANENFMKVRAENVDNKLSVRLLGKKTKNGFRTFGRRTARSINRDVKAKETSFNSLEENKKLEFISPNAMDEKVHSVPQNIATFNDYSQEVTQHDLNKFFHRMEMLAIHIDKLHEQYLRYNELNDDYISQEFPSEYFEK